MNNILWLGVVALAFAAGAILAYYSADTDPGPWKCVVGL
jgi:hypothetical protein